MTDPDDLVGGLRRVRSADEATRRRWIAEGRRLMEERFSLQAAAARLEQVLDRAARR